MARSAGEMPFLDHLEELRQRILKSAAALIAGIAVGLWMVGRFELIVLLKRPIEPYLPAGGKLIVTSPTEPVMIVLKMGFAVGLVLASPVIIYQLWAFLSPALYARERKALVPGLLIGLLLFLLGAVLGYVFIVPQALRVLFSFQSEALAPFISYDNYFSFVLQIVMALGISFELPLVIILLALFGILTPAALHRFRRFAIVLSCIAGAILSPGTDVISMIMMTVPLIFLYEVGVAGAVIVHRRRKRREMSASTAAVLLLLAIGGASAASWGTRRGAFPAIPSGDFPAIPARSARAQARSIPRPPPGWDFPPGPLEASPRLIPFSSRCWPVRAIRLFAMKRIRQRCWPRSDAFNSGERGSPNGRSPSWRRTVLLPTTTRIA